MAFHLNVRDMYKVGEAVSFWAALDPNDQPVTLPFANPYRILAGDRAIHQPVSPRGEVKLEPQYPLKWSWDQRDQSGRQVVAGHYKLQFFGPSTTAQPFSISSSLWPVIKTAAKWCPRASVFCGPLITCLDAVSGTAITMLALPFELIEADPPDQDFGKLAEPVPVEFDTAWIRDATTREIMIASLRLSAQLFAIQKTIERIQGAQDHKDESAVHRQEQHLEYLASEASRRTATIGNAVRTFDRLVSERPMIDAAEASQAVQKEFEQQYTREILRKMVQSGAVDEIALTKGADTLQKTIEALPWSNTRPSVILREFQYEMDRFASTLAAPPAIAAAA